MNANVSRLLEALNHPEERHAARDELIACGPSIAGQLLAVWREGTPARRRTILSVLSEWKDVRAAEAFRAALDDPDENVRAVAAQGLYRLQTPDAIDALTRTIDDAPDPLHYDVTPSVQALSAIGLAGLAAVLPLLSSEAPRTRQHAQKVLELVAAQITSRGGGSDEAMISLWRRNGSYRWDGPEDERAESVWLWRQWVNDGR